MKTNKVFEKIVNIDLDIHKDATSDDLERYDAALPIISYNLLKENIGDWGGRETSLKGNDDYVRTNYWFVIESGLEKAQKEIKRIVENFSLSKITKLRISSPQKSNADYKTQLENNKELSWSWRISK
jgi:ribosomal protein L16 Arg81 hydroxylase